MATGPHIVVVGAGIAGLSAAFRLKQAGAQVTVLDQGGPASVGGRMATIDHEGFPVDTGATLLTSQYRSMLRLIADSGLAGEIIPANDVVGIVRSAHVNRVHTSSRLRMLFDGIRGSAFPKRDLLKILNDFREVYPLIDPADMSRLSEHDTESVSAYAQRRGLRPDSLDYFLEPLVKSPTLGEPEQLSMVSAFAFLRVLFVGGGFFTSRKGVGFLTQGLASQLNVEYGARVTSVEQRGDEVVVTWSREGESERVATGSGCVLAVPPPQALVAYPQLAPGQRDYLANVTYSCSVHIAFGLDRPTAESSVLLQIPRVEHPDLMAYVLEHNQAHERVPHGRGLIMAHHRDSWSRENWELDDARVIEHALDATRRLRILPELERHMTTALVCRVAPGLVLRRPGDYRAVSAFARTLDPNARVQFASGDFLGHSTTDASVCAGERAARNLIAALHVRTEAAQARLSSSATEGVSLHASQ